MEMVNASVAVEQLDDVVNTVMSSHGFGSKQSLTLDDFQKIMSDYSSELSDASLQTPAGGENKLNEILRKQLFKSWST